MGLEYSYREYSGTAIYEDPIRKKLEYERIFEEISVPINEKKLKIQKRKLKVLPDTDPPKTSKKQWRKFQKK